MRLTRLEIFGFKSFVERFVLNFDAPLIGVVGPNGCGKSNIVDALRWVLGETHAKQLRGTLFDDLIFNGSESRRPLGMAEVSISIRPDESFYQAKNGVAVVENTEQLIASGDDVGSEHDDGRGEEGDGVTPEAVEKEIQEIENELYPTSLYDIPGIFEATEIQLTRRLYRSGESEYFINKVPCRLRDMIELYRLIGLGARGLSIVQQGQIGQIVSKKPTERRELLEEAAGISGFRARLEAAQRKLSKTAENMARLADIILEIEKQLRVLRRQASRARSRKELKDTLRRLELEAFEAKVTLNMLKKRDRESRQREVEKLLSDAEARLAQSTAEQESIRAQMTEVDVELFESRSRRDLLNEKVQAERARHTELRVSFASVESAIASVVDQIGRLNQRVSYLDADLETKNSASEAFKKQIADAEIERSEAESRLENLKQHHEHLRAANVESVVSAELDGITEEIKELVGLYDEIKIENESLKEKQRSQSEAQKRLEGARVKIVKLSSEKETLESQLDAYAEHVADKIDSELVDASHRTIAGVVTVDAQYQRALAAVLGERANYLVSDRPDVLASAYSQKQKLDSAADAGKIGVVKKAGSRTGSAELPHHIASRSPSATRLLDLLQVRDGFRTALESLLGNVYFVSSFDDAMAFIAEENSQWIAVTEAGEIAAPWGWCSTEGQGVSLSLSKRIEELTTAIAIEENTLQSLEQEATELEKLVESAKQSVVAKQREQERIVSLEQKRSQLLEQVRSAERERENELRKIEEEAQQKVRSTREVHFNLTKSLEYEARRIAELVDERERIIQSIEEQSRKKEHLIKKKDEIEVQLQERRRVDESGGDAAFQEMQLELAQIEQQVREIEKKRDELSLSLSSSSQEFDHARRSLDALKKEASELELFFDKVAMETEMAHEDIRRYYGEEIKLPEPAVLGAGLSMSREELIAKHSEAQEEARAIRNRLEREGEVDPESIARCEEEETRLEEMRRNYEDIDAASKTLQRTISQLKEISRRRFIETFEFVSTKFEELVPRLFGGGAGTLKLINPDDPLTSGVEIAVRPPGKKLRTMELLSGGEKALSATALIVAMFLYRPSPICVLDEVDAPLDDANLDRFLGLIGEISEQTQFLIITHNKQSMASMNRLIGITMQESGVSTAVTVSLEEAERELERAVANG